MSRLLTAMPAAALAVAVLTGCGADPAPAAAPAATDKAPASADPQGKRRQMEAMRADCMKGKGFKYTANVPGPRKIPAEELQARTGDYDAMRKDREKRGFGVFSGYVYSEPTIRQMFDGNPNTSILKALSETQQKAWDTADQTCYGAAFSKFTGKKVTSSMDALAQMSEKSKELRGRELDGDGELIKLAQAFGDCLKGKGHRVTSLKPTAIARAGQDRFQAEVEKLGAEQHPGEKSPGFFPPELTPDQARPYLTREIKGALEDLECGKDFYAVYQPKQWEVAEKVDAEFGVKEGLFGE
ncbi:hypothetical protein FHR32_001883 [Streptosporangium album]|uniref:Lipoprotein n=1 Tax=Streptosporangium album TaxID=47479 RepID=A0A7W7RSU5_9ACTN|nr:hypothetical protein [Streptosporangium album]MBB4937578.1 hypothetical protein [Streptosporangium album]